MLANFSRNAVIKNKKKCWEAVDVKRLFVTACVILLVCGFGIALAETGVVPIDGRYTYGEIMPISGENTSKQETAYRQYTFEIPESGVLSVHWVINLGSMRVIIRDIDEVRLYDNTLSGYDNPYDFDIPVKPGKHTIEIIKIAAFGGFGSVLGPDNIGDYWFSLSFRQEKSPLATAIPLGMLSPEITWTDEDIRAVAIDGYDLISTDGTYTEGKIESPKKQYELPFNNEYRRCFFKATGEGIIQLHFILRLGALGIEVRDFDGYRLLRETMYERNSPCTYNIEVKPGLYSIHLLMDGKNTGEYRFKASFTPANTPIPTAMPTPRPTVIPTVKPTEEPANMIPSGETTAALSSLAGNENDMSPVSPAINETEDVAIINERSWFTDMNHPVTYLIVAAIIAIAGGLVRSVVRKKKND